MTSTLASNTTGSRSTAKPSPSKTAAATRSRSVGEKARTFADSILKRAAQLYFLFERTSITIPTTIEMTSNTDDAAATTGVTVSCK